jgi:hypothetical protein
MSIETTGRNYYRDIGIKADADWAMSRIYRHLEDFLDGGPDWEIVCRGVAHSVGIPPEAIREMWVKTRAYKRERDAKREAEAQAQAAIDGEANGDTAA